MRSGRAGGANPYDDAQEGRTENHGGSGGRAEGAGGAPEPEPGRWCWRWRWTWFGLKRTRPRNRLNLTGRARPISIATLRVTLDSPFPRGPGGPLSGRVDACARREEHYGNGTRSLSPGSQRSTGPAKGLCAARSERSEGDVGASLSLDRVLMVASEVGKPKLVAPSSRAHGGRGCSPRSFS